MQGLHNKSILIFLSTLLGLLCSYLIISMPPAKYILAFVFFLFIAVLLIVSQDRSLYIIAFLLFFTAVDRRKPFVFSPYSQEQAGITVFLFFLLCSVLYIVARQKHIPIDLKKEKKLITIYCCYLGICLLMSLRTALLISFSFFDALRYFSLVLLILFWERVSKGVSEDTLHKYILVLFFIGAFEGVLAISEVFFHVNMSHLWLSLETTNIYREKFAQAGGTFGGYTALGHYSALLFPFLFSIYFYRKSNVKLICLILTGIGLFLSYARIAWFGAFIGVLLIVFILAKRRILSLKRLFILSAASFILTTVILSPFYKIFLKATDVLLLKRGDTFVGRVETYITAWKIVKDSNFLGIGLNNYWDIMLQKYAYSARYIDIAHNGYLVVLAESGLIGLILFLTAYIYLLVLGFRLLKQSTNGSLGSYALIGMIGSIVSFFIGNTLNMTIVYNNVMNLFWNIIAIGLAYGLYKEQKIRTS
jgi:O-antigen ligase